MNEMTKEVLDELEAQKLATLNEDVIMKEAFRKLLLAGVTAVGTYIPGKNADPRRNWALRLAWNREGNIPRSNEELGQDLRALTRAIEIIEEVFDEQLSKFTKKEETPVKEEENPAE